MEAKIESYLDAKKTKPLDESQLKLFVQCTMAEAHNEQEFGEQVAKEMGFPGMVMWKRLAVCSPEVKVTSTVAAFLLSTCTTPAEIVMWSYTINRLFKDTGRLVNMTTLATAFPIGFPPEKERDRLWDAQKARRHGIDGDNMVDKMEVWR